MKCPKCEYERTKQDDELHPITDCPKCGVIYSRVNIKQTKTETAKKKVIEEENRKKEFVEGQDERIQQMATKINNLPSKQRIETIIGMSPTERAIFLQTKSTIEALKGMSSRQRKKYLYGSLYKYTKNNPLLNIIKGLAIGIPVMLGILYGLNAYVEDMRDNQLPPGLITHSSSPSSGPVTNSDWDGSVAQVKSWIKSNIKDPSSLKFVEWSPVTKTENGFLVRVKYRAKNSFGAFVVEEKLFLLSPSGSILKWSNY